MKLAFGFSLASGLHQGGRGTPVPPVGPGLVVAPEISGTAEIGAVLTCTTGTWTGTGALAYARQWRRDGAAIPGATGASYTLAPADDEARVTCSVTATDDTASRTASAPGVPVSYPSPGFTAAPGFGAAVYAPGDTVTLSAGAAGPAATIALDYFRLNDADRSGELSGLSWDSAGAAPGPLTARFRASNSGGAVLSSEATAALSAAPASAPATLFARSPRPSGVWLDPSDMATLYRDAAGTTPVAGAGDPVGRVEDKSGNGNHAILASGAASGNRPTLRQTGGGLWYLDFDGVDDFLLMPWYQTSEKSHVMIVGLELAAAVSYAAAIGNVANYGVTLKATQDGSTIRALAQAGSGIAVASPPSGLNLNTPTLVTAAWDRPDGEVRLRYDGTQVARGSGSGNLTSDDAVFLGKSGAGNFNGRIYGLVSASTDVAAQDLAENEAYVAGQAGVTL